MLLPGGGSGGGTGDKVGPGGPGEGGGRGGGVGTGSGPGTGPGTGPGFGPGEGGGPVLLAELPRGLGGLGGGTGGGVGPGTGAGFGPGTGAGGGEGTGLGPGVGPGMGPGTGGGIGGGTGTGAKPGPGGPGGTGGRVVPGGGGEGPGGPGTGLVGPGLGPVGGEGPVGLPIGAGTGGAGGGPVGVGGGLLATIGGAIGQAAEAVGLPIGPAGGAPPAPDLGQEAVAPGLGAKELPQGIFASLAGSFDLPVGITNSDFMTDEQSTVNLLASMRERSNVRVRLQNRFLPVEYPALQEVPLLFVSGHKAFSWTDAEREALRQYVGNGGTIVAEDCHGPFAQTMERELRRVFGQETEQVSTDDDLYRAFYVLDREPTGDMGESLPLEGIRTADGRLGVILSRNDYSDSLKVPEGGYVSPQQREQATRMYMNIYMYALGHWRQSRGEKAVPQE